MAVETRATETPAAGTTTELQVALDQLTWATETAEMPAVAAPRAADLALLAGVAQLSADPEVGEPIEDAHRGAVQSLTVAQAF